MKITVENQAILKRLQRKPPTYSVAEWDRQYNRVQKLRENLCEHPYVIGEGSKHRFMLTTAHTENGEGFTSLPRIGTSQPGMRGVNRTSYNSLGQQYPGG